MLFGGNESGGLGFSGADRGMGRTGGWADRGGGDRTDRPMLPMFGAPPSTSMMPAIPQPPSPMGTGAAGGGGGMPPQNPQSDIMRMIMMQILAPQLMKFFGGASGGGDWGGAGTSMNPTGWGAPNPMQQSQGPAGMMQGPMSFLAPFIFQQFFKNMGMGGGGGANPFPQTLFGPSSGAGLAGIGGTPTPNPGQMFAL